MSGQKRREYLELIGQVYEFVVENPDFQEEVSLFFLINKKSKGLKGGKAKIFMLALVPFEGQVKDHNEEETVDEGWGKIGEEGGDQKLQLNRRIYLPSLEKLKKIVKVCTLANEAIRREKLQ